jgi:hypothetical protein
MYEAGDLVLLTDTYEGAIIEEVRKDTFIVKTFDNEVREVSEFDIIPYDLDNDEYIDYYEDDDFEDLQPYRNMNQGYY